MLDQKYRVRVNREPLVSGDKRTLRKKRLLLWGSIAGAALLVVIMLLFVLGGRNSATPQASGSPQLKLSIEEGNIQVKKSGEQDFSDATNGMTIEQGTALRTDSETLASLELSSGSVVRLNEDSRLEVSELSPDKFMTTLNGGEAWATVVGSSAPATGIITTAARVEAQSTSFDVSADERESTVAAIKDTSVVTALSGASDGSESSDAGKLFLKEDQQTTVHASTPPETEDDFETKEIPDSFRESLWYRWNSEQDELFTASVEGSEDAQGPTLRITDPSDKDETENEQIEVKGVTDLSATVTINDDEVETDKGEFSKKVDLTEGENKITVVATDPSGNETTKTLTIIRKSGKPDAVGVSLSTEETGVVKVSWDESDAEDFAEYVLKRDEQVLKRFSDKSSTEYRDQNVSAGDSYTYNVCVVDQDGQEACSQDQSATVKGDPNQAPTVSISSPADGFSVKGGTAVNFAAQGEDPDDDVLTYTWEFGDGISTTGKSVSHTYSVTSSNKTYTVKVTVTDRGGASASSSISLTVTP
ncbi:MAG: PKD domain-containing protein [Candidatus Andersenbacteria bacterium]